MVPIWRGRRTHQQVLASETRTARQQKRLSMIGVATTIPTTKTRSTPTDGLHTMAELHGNDKHQALAKKRRSDILGQQTGINRLHDIRMFTADCSVTCIALLPSFTVRFGPLRPLEAAGPFMALICSHYVFSRSSCRRSHDSGKSFVMGAWRYERFACTGDWNPPSLSGVRR